MEKIHSHTDLSAKIAAAGRLFLLLYKSGSEQSDCAYRNFQHGVAQAEGANACFADVATVRDIHPVYGITTVPALLVFNNGALASIVKGCQESGFYQALTSNTLYQPQNESVEKPPKRVTVYSTPTCSWCNTLKSWLKNNNIRYTDIDISRNEQAAAQLVRRSGQQGVPQTDINGRIVVGFDQPRLKELLEIQ